MYQYRSLSSLPMPITFRGRNFRHLLHSTDTICIRTITFASKSNWSVPGTLIRFFFVVNCELSL